MLGKHTEESITINELKKTIKRRDKEIKDIKLSLADILSEIKNLNESNDYGQPEVKRRKISQICTDIRYQLLIDEFTGKIIELSTNEKSKKIVLNKNLNKPLFRL